MTLRHETPRRKHKGNTGDDKQEKTQNNEQRGSKTDYTETGHRLPK